MKTTWTGLALLPVLLAAGCGGEGTGIRLDKLFASLAPKSRQQVLEESIQSAEPDKRRRALYEMSGWKGADEGMVTLVGLTVLGDSDPMTRAQAARTLGAWDHPAGVRYLAVGLAGRAGEPGENQATPEGSSPAPAASEKTAAAAGGDVTLPRLPDAGKLVRMDCAQSLGSIASPAGLKALSHALRLDPDVDVRVAAAGALKELRSPEAASALLIGLADGDLAVRRTSLDGLRYMTGQDFGNDLGAWSKHLAESADPLAGYGHPPKVKSSQAQGEVSGTSVSKIKGIFSDLFPLERKEGPFE